jgi:hypothetical protein
MPSDALCQAVRYQNIDRNPVLQIGCEEAKKISREPREDATIILGTVSGPSCQILTFPGRKMEPLFGH